MNALSLYQPWAALVVNGVKRIETRSWSTQKFERILIHASKKQFPIPADLADLYSSGMRIDYGAIIGEVTVIDCIRIESAPCWYNEITGYQVHYGVRVPVSRMVCVPPEDKRERMLGDYTPGRFAWILSDPVVYLRPIPFRGRYRLFSVMDDELSRYPLTPM